MIPVIFGLSGSTLTADEAALFRASEPAGFILFARNTGNLRTRSEKGSLHQSPFNISAK